MKEPYPYQREAVDEIFNYMAKPHSGNGLIVIPTAGGKSLVNAIFCHEIQKQWPGTRILVLTHDKRLVKQDHEEFLEQWPDAPAGIYCAGLGRKDIDAPILFASIQSIEKCTHRLNPSPEIVIIDEAQMIPREENTRYQKVLSLLKIMYPNLRVFGYTATPYRLDSGWLHKGDGALFNDIIYEVPVQFLIDGGYVCPVIPKGAGDIKINIEGIHHSKGEFLAGELEDRAMEGDITIRAVEDFIRRGADRKKWLIFTTGAKHAKQVRDALIDRGILAEMVISDNGEALNDRYINEYKSGQIKCLVTIVMLTVGFSVRPIDLLVDLGPTESAGRHVQKIGRGMRLSPGKKDCLYLDYAGNAARHGPIDAIVPKEPGQGGGVPPAKECPECQAIIAASLHICPWCGHEFPVQEIKIKEKPVEAPVLKSQIEPHEYTVTGCLYVRHKKEGKRDSVRVEYSCGFQTFKEWVFPDAATPQLAFYYGKFMSAAGIDYEEWPRTVTDFLAKPPKAPARIWVTKDGKFDRVTKKEFEGDGPLVTVDNDGRQWGKKRYDMEREEKETVGAAPVYTDDIPF